MITLAKGDWHSFLVWSSQTSSYKLQINKAEIEPSLLKDLHFKVIIGRNPIEANANTVAIQLPGNPAAYIGKCFTPYQEFLYPL